MSKIPRLNPERVSAAPSRGAAPSPAGAFVEAVRPLAEAGYEIAADAEKTQAERLQRLLEQKQAVVNEVEAGKHVSDYDGFLAQAVADAKKQFEDDPVSAPNELLRVGRDEMGRVLKTTKNANIGLAVAQRANSRLDSAVRELHTWARARQTQKAKGDLSVIVNRATAAAEGLSSVSALTSYVKAKEAELAPLFERVLGGDNAAEAVADMRTAMTRAWVSVAGDKNPVAVLAALDAKTPGNPLVDYLSGKEREQLRRETISSFEGTGKRRDLEAIKEGLASNADLFDAYLKGAPELGGVFYATKQAIVEQRNAVKAGYEADAASLKRVGIDVSGKSAAETLAILDARERFVTSLERARRAQIAYDAEDNPAEVEALLLTTNKALSSKKGRDAAAIVEQQARLAAAFSDKKISQSTFNTLFKTLSLATEKVVRDANALWDFENDWLRSELEAGHIRLRRYMKARPGIPADKRAAIQLRYMTLFNREASAGVAVDEDRARELARQAFIYETGIDQEETK